MNQARLVSFFQGIADLGQNVNRLIRRKWPITTDQLFESQSVEQLHRIKEAAAGIDSVIENANGVPVGKTRHRLNFAFET